MAKQREDTWIVKRKQREEAIKQIYAQNRSKLIGSLHQHLSSTNRPLEGFILLQSSTKYLSYFAYLFGVKETGLYGAIDIATGKSFLFVTRLLAGYALYLGEAKLLEYFNYLKEAFMVNMVCYTDEIAEVLHAHHGGPEKPVLFLLHEQNTDSNNFFKPAKFKGIERFETDLSVLHPILTECRAIKSDAELSLIRYANDISSEAHVEAMRNMRAGIFQYGLSSIFLQHANTNADGCSITCICAAGGNSSVLKYEHEAALNIWTFEDGDMALLDSGAEYNFYVSDITCSFPVNGKFTSDQKLIYNAILKAHNDVISTMKPGVNLVDMQKSAEKSILESLKDGGILVGDVGEMMIERVGAAFMPHGLGHLLGINTLKYSHTTRELKEGMVITVEPGCYFSDALLAPLMESSSTSKFFNHKEIERFKTFGGVRIKSDVYVTSNGVDNLTKCPRETWEIEAVMAGAPWPLEKNVGYWLHFRKQQTDFLNQFSPPTQICVGILFLVTILGICSLARVLRLLFPGEILVNI
ncbi:hypothetical protein MKW92_014028 [Papaver armeniacum]|nr:hypothetical protein MKW92_014028 [Papaver armeniacum]